MKILHAIQSADPVHGGPIAGIKQLAAATQGRHQHHLLSIDSPSAAFLADLPIPFTSLGPGGWLGYSPKLTPWLHLHAKEFDCVVVHGLWRYISVGCWRALRRADVPYLVMPHGMLDPWFKQAYPFKHLKKWLFWPWTEYRVLKDATAVLFTCEEERLRARDSFWLYNCREWVGTQPVATPGGEVKAQQEAFLAAHPHLHGKRSLLFLGRIHPKKGCDLLIAAFARAAADYPDIHLVMAGPCHDNWGKTLRNRADALGIGDRITWTGMLEGDLKWGAFQNAEAFLLPSHQENFGIAVAEALACGRPVLISKQVQIWREIASDGAGLFEADTLAGTEKLLRGWLELSATERKNMGERARHCFLTRFETGLAAEKISGLLARAAYT